MRRANLILGLIVVAGLAAISGSLALQQAKIEAPIRLIVRGDDMGMTHACNLAVEKCFLNGIMTCVGLIVPAPWFEEAARMAREHPEWGVGVHLALNGEWRDYKWKPVLPYNLVPSLVDEDGFFYPTTEAFLGANPNLDEVDKELRAQMDRAIKRGLNIQYIDTHMDTLNATPELWTVVQKIARDYGFPISGECGEEKSDFLVIYNTPPEKKEEVLADRLRRLGPGLWLLVVHPGLDTPEMRALVDANPEGLPNVAAHRAAEAKALQSKRIKKIIRKRGIELVDYKPFQVK
ncbi:MAG: polysaccharide deacetylase family protein [Clostridiales bacterium]|nr:polysaccharide deacetylase family protein [Clostridiales bacterium]